MIIKWLEWIHLQYGYYRRVWATMTIDEWLQLRYKIRLEILHDIKSWFHVKPYEWNLGILDPNVIFDFDNVSTDMWIHTEHPFQNMNSTWRQVIRIVNLAGSYLLV